MSITYLGISYMDCIQNILPLIRKAEICVDCAVVLHFPPNCVYISVPLTEKKTK